MTCWNTSIRGAPPTGSARDGCPGDRLRGELLVAPVAACANGDLTSLLEVLAPDAWGDVDLGPGATRVPALVTGGLRVARNLLRFWGQGATLVSQPVGGQPAVLAFLGHQLA